MVKNTDSRCEIFMVCRECLLDRRTLVSPSHTHTPATIQVTSVFWSSCEQCATGDKGALTNEHQFVF